MQLTAAAVTPPAEHAAGQPAGAAGAAAVDADVMPVMRATKHDICVIATTVAIACAGCAPINTGFPLRPPETGETYVALHSTFPFSNFAHASLQLSIFHGISRNNVLGLTISPILLPPIFCLPTGVSYGHYWIGDARDQFLQLDLALTPYNPFCQVSYAIINADGETASAMKIGAGFAPKAGLGIPFIPSSDRLRDMRVVPTIEYSIQHREARLSAGTSFGLTKRIVNSLSRTRGTERFEFSRDEIDTIIVKQEREGTAYRIVLKDGSMLNIRLRDPYADCYGCAIEIRGQNAYTASKMHRCYYVYPSKKEHPFLSVGGLTMLQLNMSEILRSMDDSNMLIIKEDEDATERSCNSVNSWIEDIFVDIGHVKYE
jgi:hypothetical protein